MNSPTIQTTGPDLSKAFFDLGWDYYAAKQGMPHDAVEHQAFVEGYTTAKDRIVQKRGNRYHLKWLQIRYGALKRNRIFDETVTPAVLEAIDVEFCPITLEVLTHSTGLESDWSIDRVSNQNGYTVGNLIIVSTKANKAKGSMTYEEIFEASKGTEPYKGLTPAEWMRWRFVCSLNISRKSEDTDQITFGYFCAPHVAEFPQLMFMNPSALLQYAIAHKALESGHSGLLAKVTNGLPKIIRSELNKLVRDAARLRGMVKHYETEVWFNERLFRNFFKVHTMLTPDNMGCIMNNMTLCREFKHACSAKVQSWNPDLKGYNQ